MKNKMACCALAALVMCGLAWRELPTQEQPRKTLEDLVKESQDPVEFVAKLLREGVESRPEVYEAVGGADARDPNGSIGHSFVINYLVNFLVDHWQDPRSEKTLEEVAQTGKRSICGDMGPTRHGEAYGALFRLRAKQLLHQLVAVTDEPGERLEAIRQYLYGDPKRLPPGVYQECDDDSEYVPSFPKPFDEEFNRRSVARDFRIAVMRELVREARECAGADAIDLVARSACWTEAYLRKYRKEMLAFAQTLSVKEAFSLPDLPGKLSTWLSEEQEALTLFERWLTETNDEKVMESLVLDIALHSKGGRDRLLSLLGDHRRVVARSAAGYLARHFADDEVSEALEALLARTEDEQMMMYLVAIMAQHSTAGRRRLLRLVDDQRRVVARIAAGCLVRDFADEEVLEALRRIEASWRAREFDEQDMSFVRWAITDVESRLERKSKEK